DWMATLSAPTNNGRSQALISQLPPPGNPLPRLDATVERTGTRNERRRGPTRTYAEWGRVLPPSYSPTWGDFALVPRFRDARLLGGGECLPRNGRTPGERTHPAPDRPRMRPL